MAIPFRSAMLLKEALGGVGDTVVDYMQQRRKEEEEKNFFGKFQEYLGQNKEVSEASGLDPQMAWMLGGRNLPGAYGATMASAKARTPQRDVFGGQQTGFYERVSPGIGTGPSTISPIAGTQPQGMDRYKNMSPIEIAIQIADPNTNPEEAKILHRALQEVEGIYAGQAGARTTATERARLPYEAEEQKKKDERQINVLTGGLQGLQKTASDAKTEMDYLVQRHNGKTPAYGPDAASYKDAKKRYDNATKELRNRQSELNAIGKDYNRKWDELGNEVKEGANKTPSGIEYEVLK